MKWDKIKELSKNKYTKPLLFFGFYIFFFAFIFIFFGNDSTLPPEHKEENMWSAIANNYEYNYEITTNENQTFVLEGKKYGNKNAFIKQVDGVITNEVYIFYDTVSVKQENEWIEIEDFVLIDDNFNSQYLDIRYIKSFIETLELDDSTINFDGSKIDTYFNDDLKVEIVSVDDKLKKIIINSSLYNIILQYRNVNGVEDFVVEK